MTFLAHQKSILPPSHRSPQTVDPLLAYARAGTSPRILARSLALGFAFGLCPIVGAPFFFCAATVGASHWLASSRALPPGTPGSAPPPPAPPIHGPALFIGNFASAPAELALAIPFIRLGEALTGAPPAPLDPAHLSLATAGGALARGLLAWGLAVPLVAAGGAAALEPVLAGLVGEGGGSAPGLSPPPTPPGGGRWRRRARRVWVVTWNAAAPARPPALGRTGRPCCRPCWRAGGRGGRGRTRPAPRPARQREIREARGL